jgi:hypothetical protein
MMLRQALVSGKKIPHRFGKHRLLGESSFGSTERVWKCFPAVSRRHEET